MSRGASMNAASRPASITAGTSVRPAPASATATSATGTSTRLTPASRSGSMHPPRTQRPPPGQAAPSHASRQTPATHTEPVAQVTPTHAAGRQRPSVKQLSPAGHGRQGQRN